MALASTAPNATATQQRIFDPLTSMRQFCSPDHASTLHKGKAGGLAARVDLQAMAVHHGVFSSPIVQDDRKGKAPEHRGAPISQQLPCPCWVARVKRLSATV
jgi:hypothetical protein